MKLAVRYQCEQQHCRQALGRGAGTGTVPTIVDNRPQAVAQRELADVIHSSAFAVAQRKLVDAIHNSTREKSGEKRGQQLS